MKPKVSLSHRSRAELARCVAQDSRLPCLSPSTVGRWLKAERLRPWCSQGWQHIHDLHIFLERARPVLQVYARARTFLQGGA